MPAKEDLQIKIKSLNDQLAAATKSLHQILISEYRLKVGMRVIDDRKELEVSSIRVCYGLAEAYGRWVLKDGSLGAMERRLWKPAVKEVVDAR